MVDAWLTRMYDRHGPRYLVACGLGVVVQAMVVLGPVLAFFPSRYEGLSVAQFSGVVLAVAGLAAVIAAVATLIARPGIRVLLRWRSDPSRDPDDEVIAWAFDGPRRLMLPSAIVALPGVPIVVALLATPGDHTTALDWIELSIGALVAEALAALAGYFTLELAFRPLRAALSDRVVVRVRSTRLTTRLLVTLFALTCVAGIAVGYSITDRDTAGAGNLLLVYAIAIGATATVAVIVVPMLAGTVLAPVRDLTQATRAVAAGRLEIHVPVTTTDELGELATGFNQMLVGLRERETLHEQLRESRARIVAASDAARRRVERDLHDGAQQRLVLVNLKLGMLERMVATDPAGAAAIAQEARGDMTLALEELRNLAHGIFPTVLENDGVAAALTDAAQRATIPASVECDGAGRYPAELEAAVYFCCLEALQNASKHAGDSARVTVRLAHSDAALGFEVADDGRGYEPAAGTPGSGVQNMADRIGAVGGTLRVETAPGRGTRIIGRVPLTDRAHTDA